MVFISPDAESAASLPSLGEPDHRTEPRVPEKSGTAWLKGQNAAPAIIPVSIWGLTEARRQGFAINEKALDEMRVAALTAYANHPKLTPVGQDGGGQGLSLNTAYLSLAATSAPTLDEKTAEALKKFIAHLLAKQDADGSWKAEGKLPPVEDVTEVRTMQALLVLSAAQQKGLVPDAWTASRDRALAWLRKNKPGEQNQSVVFQVLVAKSFGTPEEVQSLVKSLLASQNADGGWSQTKDRTSDALATGQSLFLWPRSAARPTSRDSTRSIPGRTRRPGRLLAGPHPFAKEHGQDAQPFRLGVGNAGPAPDLPSKTSARQEMIVVDASCNLVTLSLVDV